MRGVGKIRNFQPISRISETVQDTTNATMMD